MLGRLGWVTTLARTLFAAAVGAIAGHALARRDTEKPRGIEERGGVDRAKLQAESLQLLIEGEQKLLALFDARQASADARMTGAGTGALALPAATLALAKPLEHSEHFFKLMYAGVVVLVAIVFVVRMLVGSWKRRKNGPGRARVAFSSESRAAAKARKEWWDCEGTDAPIAVQQRALMMWRTRARHSREMAQSKDIASVAVALLFVIALVISVAMVAQGDFWTEAPTAMNDRR
jgi:NADH:ubiquinone oxidoreductase subunit 6 (subunit J)